MAKKEKSRKWILDLIQIIVGIGVIFSIFYSVYTYTHPPDKPINKPSIFITDVPDLEYFDTNMEELKDYYIFIQNLGNAPCVGLIVDFPNKGLDHIWRIYNYGSYGQGEVVNNSVRYKPMTTTKLTKNPEMPSTEEPLGVINPGEFFAYGIVLDKRDTSTYIIEVRCSGKTYPYIVM